LFTSPYVFDEEQARAMARAGADQLVAHMGLTTSGSIGAAVALTLEQAIERANAIATAAHAVRGDILVICHGGPLDQPENVGKALPKMREVVGFFGASSIERLPTERAISAQVKAFKAIQRI
jgi:predicted TIM-barrel enzyme